MNIFSDEYIAGFNAGHISGFEAGYDAAHEEIKNASYVRCGDCRYFDRIMYQCKKHGGECTTTCFCPQGKRRIFKWPFSK